MSFSFFEQQNLYEEQKSLFEQNELFDVAFQLLSNNKYSEQELRAELITKYGDNFPDIDNQIKLVFDRLSTMELISDKRLANVIVERFLSKGNLFIIGQLEKKGIANEIIREVLAELPDESLRALDEARSKKEAAENSDNPLTKIHLYQFLTGRKFSDTAIKRAVAHMDHEKCEECLDEETPLLEI